MSVWVCVALVIAVVAVCSVVAGLFLDRTCRLRDRVEAPAVRVQERRTR